MGIPLLAAQTPIMPIDLTALLAVFMGISVVLIPVLGLTARFALKPTVEAVTKFFESRGSDESVKILERRMALMEQQIESIESNVRHLVEIGEFHNQLGPGTSSDPRAVAPPESPEG